MSSPNHGNQSRQARRLAVRQQARQGRREAVRQAHDQHTARQAIGGSPGFFSRVFGGWWSPQADDTQAMPPTGPSDDTQAMPPTVVVADSDTDNSIADNNMMPPPPPVVPAADAAPAAAAAPAGPAPPAMAPPAAAAAPAVQMPVAPTLVEGAPFSFQLLDKGTYARLLRNNQIKIVNTPVPENTEVQNGRRVMVGTIAQQANCHRAPDVVRLIEEQGPRTFTQILLANPGYTFDTMWASKKALEAAGIIVFHRPTNQLLLTAFYWFLVPHPAFNPPGLMQAPAGPFQYQRLNLPTYNELKRNGQVRQAVVPVPHNNAVLHHRMSLVNNVITKGSQYQHSRGIVQSIDESGPKTMNELLVAIKVNQRNNHYAAKPFKALKEAGIIVYDKDERMFKLTPFYWFSLP